MVKSNWDTAFYWLLRFAVIVAAGVVVVAIVSPSPILRGAPGPAGPAGARGVEGRAGAEGDRGKVGKKGGAGDTGARGSRGDTGATGAKGTFWGGK